MFGDVYTMSIRSQQGANTTVPFRVRSEPDFHGAFADITGLYTVFIRVDPLWLLVLSGVNGGEIFMPG